MKLHVLVDNNTLIDRYFLGEPGLSFLIQDNGKQILFDAGYSDAFLINANKMHLDLLQTDYVVLSHGHLDHSWGFDPLIKMFTEAKIESLAHKTPVFIAHPDVFYTKSVDGINEIGCSIPEDKMAQHFDTHLSKEPVWLTNRLVFLGEIKRINDFENKQAFGKVHHPDGTKDDTMTDDSALAYKTKDGLIIISGCAHAGICNTIEHAKNVCNEDRILDVIGGFHLLDPPKEQLTKTLEYLKNQNLNAIHPCHCVDLASKIAIAGIAPIKEVGASLKIEYAS